MIATEARHDQIQSDYLEAELERRDRCITELQEQLTQLQFRLNLSNNPDTYILLDTGTNNCIVMYLHLFMII